MLDSGGARQPFIGQVARRRTLHPPSNDNLPGQVGLGLTMRAARQP